jgi:tRNA threonylcarbamoyladenosine biosynthesis protein TsaE
MRGDVVCLTGGLGAGKTTLARGAIEAWTGGAQEAPSPTYTLVQTYEGARGELWHVDLYRLKRAEEALELGLEDAFADAACLIEWPERMAGILPRDRLDIALEPEGEGRRATLHGRGKWGARVGSI